MKMIAKVWTEYRESSVDGYPYAIIESDGNFVSRHKTEREAEEALDKIQQAYPGEYGIATRRQNNPGWNVLVEFTDGSGYGYGTENGHFPTQAEAESSADKDRARIGKVEQNMMASSSYSVIVLRPADGGRWTAALGLGGHTTHVRGSYRSDADAEFAARQDLDRRWEDGLGYWRRVAERAGIPCTIVAVRPDVSVLRPAKGVSAWDEYAKK